MSSKHNFFTIIPHNTQFDFVGNAKNFLVMSGIILTLSLVGVAVRGINWGVEFVGGTEIQVAFGQHADVAAIRATMEGAGFENTTVQQFGAAEINEHLIRVERISVLTPEAVARVKAEVQKAAGDQLLEVTSSEREGDRITVFLKGTPMPKEEATPPPAESSPPPAAPGNPEQVALTDKMLEPNGVKLEAAVKAAGLELRPSDARRSVLGTGREEHLIFVKGVSSRVMEALKAKFGEGTIERRTDYVDATVADELRTDGILAMMYALAVILLYIAIRFDFYFSPGAIVALFHDVLVAVGVVAWVHLDFDLTLVAAFLTIIGYSINDTIVVYDRVRERLNHREKGESLGDTINRSINETLSRTILTSATTFFVCASLLAFGGRVLHGFGLAMCVGIITGTYSSFAIATPMYMWLRNKFPEGLAAPGKA
ncbi:MAG: protein translocase subunit SecF [Deltaproteobacteria bacterium]|nr:protein translocase subunit SecF [Deltaproteobacteria bacterium]